MSRPSHRGPRPERAADATCACDVFYMRTEPYLGGFRWLVVKSGALEPVVIGSAIFPSDHAAKVSGRAGLDHFLSLQNSWMATPAAP